MNTQTFLEVLAFLVCPAAYFGLRSHIRQSDPGRTLDGPYFLIFGTIGTWLVLFLVSPSAWSAIAGLLLVFIGPILHLSSASYVANLSEKTIYHRAAIWCSLAYAALTIVAFAGILIFERFFAR